MKHFVAAMVLLALPACGGDEETAAEPETFDVSGLLLLINGASSNDDGSCSGSDTFGYGDITEGTTVVILDSSGNKVALGKLESGKVRPALTACEFPFTIEGVPSGEPVYSIEVANRSGGVDFTEDEADDVTLTLGST